MLLPKLPTFYQSNKNTHTQVIMIGLRALERILTIITEFVNGLLIRFDYAIIEIVPLQTV